MLNSHEKRGPKMNNPIAARVTQRKLFILILIFIGVLLVGLYLKTFYTEGAYFEGVFLRKETKTSASYYIGSHEECDIRIVVDALRNTGDSVSVRYSLPNNIDENYKVDFITANNWDEGVNRISHNGNTLFQGKYIKGDIILKDVNEGPIFEDYTRIVFPDKATFNNEYKISKIDTAKFASYHNDTIRGKYEYFICALVLALVLMIDIKYPKLFFKLKHGLDVSNPEPSDFYIDCQRLAWVVYPIIIVVLFLVAI